jgi:3-dehydrosphinganine reductase
MKTIGNNSIALVTGGSSGIGLATARGLARRGSNVWILARNPTRLEEALALLERERVAPGQRFGALRADVSDQNQVFASIDRLRSEAGPPDLVINSAGETLPGYVEELELDIFRQLMQINYFGSVYTTKAVLPDMLKRGSGHIVFISSMGGLISVFGYTAYCPTKFALHGFADALRQEMKPCGVRVSIVCPPDTDTPQLAFETPYKPKETRALTSRGGVFTPEFIADQIINGVSRRKYLIIPGFGSKLFYLLKRYLGAGFDAGMDLIIARARRNGSPS